MENLYSAAMMESNADSRNDQPVFAAELFPYRSLGRKGFKVLLGMSGAICFIYGMFFIVTGAWPIGFFFGLDFLLLYGAFWLNYRSGRVREEVTVSRTDVAVRKFSPSGRMIEHHFNPFWTRFLVRRHQEIGILSMHIFGEGKRTDVGSFLNPDDRESFAKAFKGALATVRQRI
ncbi:putative membrane protein [Rhizobium sp. BK275]|nr:putative membrane protein [Rhizobium sp. BK275]